MELGTFLIKFDISFTVQTLETVKSELDGDVSEKGAYSFFITIICLNFNFMSWGTYLIDFNFVLTVQTLDTVTDDLDGDVTGKGALNLQFFVFHNLFKNYWKWLIFILVVLW